jgi:hypothetical protein
VYSDVQSGIQALTRFHIWKSIPANPRLVCVKRVSATRVRTTRLVCRDQKEKSLVCVKRVSFSTYRAQKREKKQSHHKWLRNLQKSIRKPSESKFKHISKQKRSVPWNSFEYDAYKQWNWDEYYKKRIEMQYWLQHTFLQLSIPSHGHLLGTLKLDTMTIDTTWHTSHLPPV